MRLSNRSRIPIYNFVLTLINVLIVIGLAGFILEKTRLAMFGNESILFVLLPVVLLILFLMRGRQIFEYDSDGEAVNFNNVAKGANDIKGAKDVTFKNLYINGELVK